MLETKRVTSISPELIGFDFDGVIADIGEAFIRIVCEEHGFCKYTLDQITSFHVEKCTDIPEEVVNHIFSTILKDSISTGLKPLHGVKEVLQAMASKTRIHIITARSEKQPVVDWLDHWLGGSLLRSIDVIAMGDHDQKVRFIEERGLRYFVDDRAETCGQVAEAGLIPLLFRQPWNSGCHHFDTIMGWQDLQTRFLK